ncbi:hypothetical protein KC19_VG207600 [Ceratodon purpureus]|uniref:Uncharacterized protein n=1 Tax=Ceratodon purpureus TaxID=3225 RepID=A0A8T0HS27_CERPU|nr:hypothetical protein KC19_VG207600 [Ceratodon purpureus]
MGLKKGGSYGTFEGLSRSPVLLRLSLVPTAAVVSSSRHTRILGIKCLKTIWGFCRALEVTRSLMVQVQ